MSVKSAKQSIDHLGKDAKGNRNQIDHQKAFLSTLAFLDASSHMISFEARQSARLMVLLGASNYYLALFKIFKYQPQCYSARVPGCRQ